MKRVLTLLAMLFCLNAVQAQELKPVLTFATAQKILRGCIAYADSSRLGMAIAVFDTGGQLIVFGRMDNASLGASKVAEWKGISAATYRNATATTATWNVPTAPDIAVVPGGLPIFTKDGYALGGVGVSGAASALDVKCAEAGIKAAGLIFAPAK